MPEGQLDLRGRRDPRFPAREHYRFNRQLVVGPVRAIVDD